MAELRDAPPEFYDRIDRLVGAHFPHLANARFRVQVRDTGIVEEGTSAWAAVDTPNNPDEAQRLDFSMWYAWDKWQAIDDYQRDALVFHELCHCRWDEAGNALLAFHDVEFFNAELAMFGVWWGEDAQATIDAIQTMPAPHGAEGVTEMPMYQRPQWGQTGSTGVGQTGSTGVGQTGSTGVGQTGSTGVGQTGSTGVRGVAWSDPDLQAGGDFHTVDVGGGRTIELSPAAFAAAVQSILADLMSSVGGNGAAPQQGQTGSTGV